MNGAGRDEPPTNEGRGHPSLIEAVRAAAASAGDYRGKVLPPPSKRLVNFLKGRRSDPGSHGRDSSSDGSKIVVRYVGRTDVGLVREHNEDNFLLFDVTANRRSDGREVVESIVGKGGLVFAVCDGMGGAAAGEVASRMAVEEIQRFFASAGPPRDRDAFARRLVRAIESAGAHIFEAAHNDRTRKGMGTTSTVAGLIDATLFVGQVGDSRAYVLRGDQFGLITKDQSLVNQLIEAGQLTEEEAESFEHANIILQALGTTESVAVDLTFLELRRGDRLLLCSDGLSGMVHADLIKEVLQTTPVLSEAADKLIALANQAGGHDNITVVLVEFVGPGLKEANDGAKVAYQRYPLPPEDGSEKEGGEDGGSLRTEGEGAGATTRAWSFRWWMWLIALIFVGGLGGGCGFCKILAQSPLFQNQKARMKNPFPTTMVKGVPFCASMGPMLGVRSKLTERTMVSSKRKGGNSRLSQGNTECEFAVRGT
ncbi:MAG: Stp1/IreP family PP2C-type Ser/Thr phosphatase [Sandaracinaceae bacterium]|nr:Stp1/IreP family PP2C-type Ser/Thr phosphatase [Sandaracinaceae bacterium]